MWRKPWMPIHFHPMSHCATAQLLLTTWATSISVSSYHVNLSPGFSSAISIVEMSLSSTLLFSTRSSSPSAFATRCLFPSCCHFAFSALVFIPPQSELIALPSPWSPASHSELSSTNPLELLPSHPSKNKRFVSNIWACFL